MPTPSPQGAGRSRDATHKREGANVDTALTRRTRVSGTPHASAEAQDRGAGRL